jgi:hypothetical protein
MTGAVQDDHNDINSSSIPLLQRSVNQSAMAAMHSVDPGGLQEFSVVFTDRSLNHMSQKFQSTMRDISATLKRVYNADGCAIVPGGGSYGMEAGK